MKMKYTSKTAVYTYKLIKSTENIEGKAVKVNGVLVFMSSKRKKSCNNVCMIRNISEDRLFVEKIIKCMRRFAVSPINAVEIIEDILQRGDIK